MFLGSLTGLTQLLHQMPNTPADKIFCLTYRFGQRYQIPVIGLGDTQGLDNSLGEKIAFRLRSICAKEHAPFLIKQSGSKPEI